MIPSAGMSYRRHQRLIDKLAPLGEAERLPVAWHALWRLPPRMKWVRSMPRMGFGEGILTPRPGKTFLSFLEAS
jgi:hypothetical protein